MITKTAAAKALSRRKKTAIETTPFVLEDFLFPEQLLFVKDCAANKLAVCSRRAGKTVSCSAHLIDVATNTANVVCLYITLSRNNAKKIIWRDLLKINKEYKLNGVPNLTELSLSFSNGSIIYLSGAKDKQEIANFRGLALKLCYIDEAQSFRTYIKELIDDVLAPALMDHAGTLCLIGTPSPVKTGFFYDSWASENGWSKHHWTFLNNPFLTKTSKMTHEAMLDRELKRRGVGIEDSSIQREWFGKWVNDSDSLLIHYTPAKNHYLSLPQLPQNASFNYILGIDLGFNDADALAVIAWSEQDKTTYLVEEIVTPEQGLTELVEQVNFLNKKYDISKMVIDEGGLGKKLAEEMRRRHGIPVQGADKTRKMENIAFLNDALRSEKFKAKSASKFAQDSYLVEIDREKTTPTKIVVSNRYHSDIIDAVLYAFKESPAFTYQAQEQKPIYGSKAWAIQQHEEMFEHELKKLQEEAEMHQIHNNLLKNS